MDAKQCEFLAGDIPIQMKPRFSSCVLEFLAGTTGPFEAGMPVTVPLWLAVDCRKRQKCEIIPPAWMTVEGLKVLLVTEGESSGLTQLPECFFEIAHMLVRHAKEDLVDGDQLKTLVQDIWDKREAKLRTSMFGFLAQSDTSHARVDNVQRLELISFRSPILAACEQTDRLVNNYHRIVAQFDSQ